MQKGKNKETAKKTESVNGEKKKVHKKGGNEVAFRPQSIVEARYNLDRRQNDIMDIAFGMIDDQIDKKEYSIRVADVKEYYNIEDKSHAYRFLKQAVESLEGKGFKLKKDENTSIFYPWFSKITYVRAKNEENSHIDFKMDDDLKRMIVESRRGAYYSIRYAINLSNKYAKRLYYLFQDRKNWNLKNPDMETGVFTIAIDEMLRMLDCPKSYKYTDFKRYVIKPSMEQINGSTDIYFEYEENKGKLKSGQKGVLSLTFHVTQLSANSKVVAESPFYEITKQHSEVKKYGYSNSEVRDILSMAKKYGRDRNFIKEALAIVERSKCESRVGLACYFMKNGYNQPYEKEQSWENKYKMEKIEGQKISPAFHQREYDYEKLERDLLSSNIQPEEKQVDSFTEQGVRQAREVSSNTQPEEKQVVTFTDQRGGQVREISVDELQKMMAGNPQLQREIASLLEKMNSNKL